MKESYEGFDANFTLLAAFSFVANAEETNSIGYASVNVIAAYIYYFFIYLGYGQDSCKSGHENMLTLCIIFDVVVGICGDPIYFYQTN